MYSEGSVLIEIISNTFYWTLEIISFAIIARVLLSWIGQSSMNDKIIYFLYQITEPILGPIRQLLNKFLNYRSRIDLSPLIAILILQFLKTFFR